jgi:hypothetical protein
MLAKALGLRYSPTLRAIALGGRPWKQWRLEEGAVLSLQAYALAAGADITAIMEGDE